MQSIGDRVTVDGALDGELLAIGPTWCLVAFDYDAGEMSHVPQPIETRRIRRIGDPDGLEATIATAQLHVERAAAQLAAEQPNITEQLAVALSDAIPGLPEPLRPAVAYLVKQLAAYVAR